MWSSGNIAAQATAKSVIASAKRLIDVRHCCRNSSRIAEISVPAWPMPIHQTKLMMSNAQPTGMLLPQMPMPVSSSLPMVMFSTISSRNAMAKPKNQPIGVCFVRTVWLIVSVTDSNVCPGSMTAGVRSSSACSACRRVASLRMRGMVGHQCSTLAARAGAGVGSSSVFGFRTIAR